ncbi:MAG: helix-hairpin-helix domain-containing protein [Oligoflexia bacterium]|nr:helix-hairpin-helix domain-containing protein [Oligoflexia bacterium]
MGKSVAETTELLEEIQRLMELKGENPFKVRAFERAAQTISAAESDSDLEKRARAGSLTELAGVGKGIADVLTEFLLHGKSTVRDELLAALPEGLLQLTQVPGLGPKKARLLIDELGIHSLGELEYACKENRLLKLPGFGEKIQHKIQEGVRFLDSTRGMQRLSEAFASAGAILPEILAAADGLRVSETGALRRRVETLSALEFLVEVSDTAGARAAAEARVQKAIEQYRRKHGGTIAIEIHYSAASRFGYELARTTGSEAHWLALSSGSLAAGQFADCESEEKFYARLGLPVIAPEMRETGEEVALARRGELDQVLPWNGIRGVFHNHTTRSDGTATLEQMVVAAKQKGFSYIGISDHSQSAFYAHGLKSDDLKAQEKEIRDLQQNHPDIRIFWGVESDILADGSLDYEVSELKRFDFVVASIHSRFQMDRETMTQRVLEAVRNPYTTFLGHATGRLLLGRKGYELDMEKIIEEAARRKVAIEINANPARLDIDWRWGPSLRKNGTFVSVNPDAHDTAGLDDTLYGIAMARKALLPSSLVVNSRSADEVAEWLKRG